MRSLPVLLLRVVAVSACINIKKKVKMTTTIIIFGAISIVMVLLAFYMLVNKVSREILFKTGKRHLLFSNICLFLFGISFYILIPLRVIYLGKFEILQIETMLCALWLSPFISLGLGGIIGWFYQSSADLPKKPKIYCLI